MYGRGTEVVNCEVGRSKTGLNPQWALLPAGRSKAAHLFISSIPYVHCHSSFVKFWSRLVGHFLSDRVGSCIELMSSLSHVYFSSLGACLAAQGMASCAY